MAPYANQNKQILSTYCPNIYCAGKVKYKLIMRMGGDLFELELYHKIIKKCLVLRDLWKTTFEYTLQKFYWLHVIPNSKSVLENHKKFTDVVRFFQFILSCIIMYVSSKYPSIFIFFKYIFLQVGLAPPFSHRNLFSSTSFCSKLQKCVGAIKTVSLSYELLTTHVSTKKTTSKFSRIIEPIRLFWQKTNCTCLIKQNWSTLISKLKKPGKKEIVKK